MTTPVQASCIKTLVRAGKIEAATKCAVMANIEPGYDAKGERGAGFFIGNAESDAVAAGMSKHQFAAGLSAMKKKGMYLPSEDDEYRGHYGYFFDIDRSTAAK